MRKVLTRSRVGSTLAVAAAVGAVAVGVQPGAGVAAKRKPAVARNVIFINGDGMGAPARHLIQLATIGAQKRLIMDELPYAGLNVTDPGDPKDPVTDSAAAATAWATGHKTPNGTISVDAKGRALPTVLEAAKRAGKATGLVTTAQVTDASPAAFAAHVVNRGAQDEIARQYLTASRPQVILGGGEDWWLPAGSPGAYEDKPAKDPEEASKGTKGDLIASAKRRGYTYVSDAQGLRAAPSDRKLLGLFANEEMFEQNPEGEGDLYAPVVSLATMTRKALRILGRDKQGFFLFLEEEGIDEMGHENNAHLLVKAGAALDRAVGVAVAYQRRHPDTLIVVTGDHETGGLAIETAGGTDESGDGLSKEDELQIGGGSPLKVAVDWTTGQHTGAPTPLTAGGPGAARFTGMFENTEVHGRLLAAMRKGR